MGHHDAFAEAVIAIVPVEPRARRSDCDPPTDTAYALRARMLDCESASLLPASTSAQTGDGAVRPWGASHIMLGTSSILNTPRGVLSSFSAPTGQSPIPG